MDRLLVILAIVAQFADAGLTCRQLQRGHARELNPLLPESCAGIVAVKGAALGALFVLPRPYRGWYAGALIGSGVLGVTLTLVWRE